MRALCLLLVAACGHETATCGDDLAINLENFTVDGYNAVVKNSGGGTVNLNWTCPGGGSATVAGTVNTQTITYTVDWTFHMCSDTGPTSNLTIDGTLHSSVTNGTANNTKVETDHSDALKLFGHNDICHADPIDNTCVVDYTIAPAGDQGSICGIMFP